jgi:hypothetical protein
MFESGSLPVCIGTLLPVFVAEREPVGIRVREAGVSKNGTSNRMP